MRKFSFLLSRRWVLFFVVVILLSWLAWVLGEWQFHRLEDRKDRNEVIERNVHADPVPVEDVLSADEPVPHDAQWKKVSATGTYDVAGTIIVRYRTRDGASGVDVVVPLVPREGPALLVDRGWMSTGNSGTSSAADVPAPPSGEVRITGWVRQDATGDSTKVSAQSTRAISSTRIAEALDIEAYRGFVDLERETPEPADALDRAELPDTGNGPHFFYGLQWWFFGVLAIIGFIWMAVDEYRGKTHARSRRKPARKPARKLVR
ncbi:MAG TPA: SURF1 family protein [Nocardioides sp.]